MAVRLLIVVSLAAVASSGCSLNLGDSPFICNTGEPQCPLGYACKSNYCVKDGKCPDHVPGCEGSTAKCGNGKCEAGEITSCPKDCTGTGDARPPDMGQVPWEQGVPPPDMMQSHDWDPWPPDKFIPSPDLKPALAGYGYKCLNGHPACEPGLDCVAVGSATTAFCTHKCTSTTGAQCPGTPPRHRRLLPAGELLHLAAPLCLPLQARHPDLVLPRQHHLLPHTQPASKPAVPLPALKP